MSDKICEIDGCETTLAGKNKFGVCYSHRNIRAVCPGCGERYSGNTPLCRSCFLENNRIPCKIDGCENKILGHQNKSGLCGTHKHLTSFCACGELKNKNNINCSNCHSSGHITKQGYMRITIKNHAFLPKGKYLEHRVVMADKLGRKLFTNENVHHVNGNRLDNRIENLELWVTSQPSGQRAEDLAAWAKELLKIYEPEALVV